VCNLIQKLDFRNRVQAVVLAYRTGFAEQDGTVSVSSAEEVLLEARINADRPQA
jgi:hypothetical protein